MKISFITTIFNEEEHITTFLDSLFSQTKLPDEIILVDGGSRDETVEIIKQYQLKKKKKIPFSLLLKKGNRSVGRNEAIKKAKGDIIVCSDAGNILDKNWIKEIIKPFVSKEADVIAGYYKGKAKNIFQKALIPYVLVMPDKLDAQTFLPATRSIAFTKKIWKRVGGFDVHLSHNEDYIFAHKLQKAHAKIIFAKDAIVYWLPRNSFKESFIMFFRFALGDAEAGVFRSKVLFLFARYFLAWYLLFLTMLYKSVWGFMALLGIFFCYFLWAIKKNYRYVKKPQAILLLPELQLTADTAVIWGTIWGVGKNIRKMNYFSIFKNNSFLIFILFMYTAVMTSIMQWGIPNQQHPFPYHMDEWHQLQAVGNTFRYGTPNMFGSANGTMFHFLLSGFYLIPFSILHIIDPFSLQIDNFFMRERMFMILRLQTIIFGALSMTILYAIAKLLKIDKKLAIVLFTFSPVWLMLSGYFKYDIALIFWILLAFFCIIRFAKLPTRRNFIIAGIPVALAIAVKVSAIPLLLIYVLSYIWFLASWKHQVKTLLLGLIAFFVVLILFGFPDTLFGRGNVLLYLYENIIQSPAGTSNFNFGIHPLIYLFTRHYPILFGHGLFFLFGITLLIFPYLLIKNGWKKYSFTLFIFMSFSLFLASILPLLIFGGGNRSLVLLPFMVLFICLIGKKIIARKDWLKNVWVVFVGLAVLIQLLESGIWVHTKLLVAPQVKSASWIERNIAPGTHIGLENIPIYQGIPDTMQKEFYLQQYKIKSKQRYTYTIVDVKDRQLPSVIILTNGDIESQVVQQSVKKELRNRLEKENYRRIASFSPDFTALRFFTNETDFYFSWLIPVPLNTVIYRK